MKQTEILRVDGVTKKFPGTVALDHVDFECRAGEVHGLVGQNGAGKSTLMNILNGSMQPESGRIFVKGKETRISNSHVAQQLGIRMVHQELKLFLDLSVAENICFGQQSNSRLLVNWANLYERGNAVLGTLAVTFGPRDRVRSLSIAQRQQVEIAKALSRKCELMIMDEPTASLTFDETENLFEVIRSLSKRGISVIYISHRLEEVFKICDRVTVLRDGRKIDTLETLESTEAMKSDIVKMMIGSHKLVSSRRKASVIERGDVVLRVERLRIKGKLDDISFQLHRGEILGLAGLMGSGRTELLLALFGALRTESGEVFVHGKRVDLKTPVDSIRVGLALMPEDRKNQGLVLGMSIKDNITLPSLKRLSRFGFLRLGHEEKVTNEFFNSLNVKANSTRQRVGLLSGGNQQKIVFAKWLFANTNILLLDEPTRGIDVGAKEEVFKVIEALSAEGRSVIFVSSELDEVARLADRILVLYDKKIVKELPGGIDVGVVVQCATGVGVS